MPVDYKRSSLHVGVSRGGDSARSADWQLNSGSTGSMGMRSCDGRNRALQGGYGLGSDMIVVERTAERRTWTWWYRAAAATLGPFTAEARAEREMNGNSRQAVLLLDRGFPPQALSGVSVAGNQAEVGPSIRYVWLGGPDAPDLTACPLRVKLRGKAWRSAPACAPIELELEVIVLVLMPTPSHGQRMLSTS